MSLSSVSCVIEYQNRIRGPTFAGLDSYNQEPLFCAYVSHTKSTGAVCFKPTRYRGTHDLENFREQLLCLEWPGGPASAGGELMCVLARVRALNDHWGALGVLESPREQQRKGSGMRTSHMHSTVAFPPILFRRRLGPRFSAGLQLVAEVCLRRTCP